MEQHIFLTALKVIEWLANDLHYGSSGQNFYANHLLADRVKDFGSLEDEYKEAFYLGHLEVVPPDDSIIATYSIEQYRKVVASTECLLSRLYTALDNFVHQIEVMKRDSIVPCGVHAILDDASRKALVYKFLVRSEIEGGEDNDK